MIFERRYKIAKIGWFGIVRGHLRSFEIASFDRAYTSSCWCSIVNNYVPILHYSCNIGRYRQYEPTPLLFGAAFGLTPLEFRRDFWHKKTECLVIVRRCLRDPTFSGFSTVPAWDRRQTDGRTDGQTHDDSIYCTSIA